MIHQHHNEKNKQMGAGAPYCSNLNLNPNANPYFFAKNAFVYMQTPSHGACTLSNKNAKYKKNINCLNCGYMGHTSKRCNFPITSYGIVCYNDVRETEHEGPYREYIMIKRKDSLSYIEFLRGKYNLNNKDYIIKMFKNMSNFERELIFTTSFNDLWNKLWYDQTKRKYSSDYQNADYKISQIKNGYELKTINNETIIFDFEYIKKNLRNTDFDKYHEPEWEFPKGRRQVNEYDIQCAVREFSEETGISGDDIEIISKKPWEEIYTGTNKIRYRNIYFIARFKGNGSKMKVGVSKSNRNQMKEIGDVECCKYEEVINRIRDIYVERQELFKRIHNSLKKKV